MEHLDLTFFRETLHRLAIQPKVNVFVHVLVRGELLTARRKDHVITFSVLTDCGEQRVHPEEPLVPAGGGDAVLPAAGEPGVGHPAGLLLPGEGVGLHLLGQEEARAEEGGLARRQGTPSEGRAPT